MSNSFKRDIKAIIVMLATQGLINLGEMKDPLKNQLHFNLEGGELFIQLLEVLKEKTSGNLTSDEQAFLDRAIVNLTALYEQKKITGK